jgi:hypothetical protein
MISFASSLIVNEYPLVAYNCCDQELSDSIHRHLFQAYKHYLSSICQICVMILVIVMERSENKC